MEIWSVVDEKKKKTEKTNKKKKGKKLPVLFLIFLSHSSWWTGYIYIYIYIFSPSTMNRIWQDFNFFTAKEGKANSKTTFSNGQQYRDTLVMNDQQKLTFIGADTGCHREDLPMAKRKGIQANVKGIRVFGMLCW